MSLLKTIHIYREIFHKASMRYYEFEGLGYID